MALDRQQRKLQLSGKINVTVTPGG
uniref:Uncharacterized protein n=1 Tax=Rhizophora mucronata TaxID=61149 RepID=A0A2P2PVQ8_RHIMU